MKLEEARKNGDELLDVEPLLVVDGLRIDYPTVHGWVRIVDDVSFEIGAKESLAIVGESGAGKSVTAMSILGLLPPGARVVGGDIRFRGVSLLGLSPKALNRVRSREIGMVFQEPMTSLDPAFTIGEQVAETVRHHQGKSRREAWARAVELLDMVGIPAARQRANDYPHQFSGGMRQRALIASALACSPSLLIADEPTTALDVTVQALVLDLLHDLRESLDMALLLITHDLGVVADISDRVIVMYGGEIVEKSPIVPLFDRPYHPYTEGLLRSLPSAEDSTGRLWSIDGSVPMPWEMPQGCRFHPRCTFAVEGVCDTGSPALVTVDEGRSARCVRTEELVLKGT